MKGTNKMRIVQCVTNLDTGGLERLAVDLALCQKAEGHEPIIYSLTHAGHFAEEARQAGIVVHAFEKKSGPRLSTLLQMTRQMRLDRPDVVHTHNHLVHHYGAIAARLTGVPVLINTRHRSEQVLENTPQGSTISNRPRDTKAEFIFRMTLPWVDSVVLISEATREYFVRYCSLPRAKSHVILNGTRLERFLAAPAHPGSHGQAVRFGTAARMVHEKDQYTLLRAFAIVLRELPAAELHFAGNGILRESLENFAKELGIAAQVHFHGNVADTPGFLSSLDIFVLSSIIEGLPVSMLEAMAAGLPIVSTNVGGIPEVAIEGENALFANISDADGLADCMVRMARMPDLARRGAIGRQIVQDRFRIEHMWEQYRKLFVSLRGAAKTDQIKAGA